MTRINGTRAVVRETDCLDHGTPLVVALKPRHVELRIKGTRKVYSMGYDAILWLAVKRDVEEQRKVKAQLKQQRQWARRRR